MPAAATITTTTVITMADTGTVMPTRMITGMNDGHQLSPGHLLTLMAWLSPSYPVGAFSYSSGIEWAVEAGDVRDAASLQDWIDIVLRDGGASCDAVLLAHAYRAALAGDAQSLASVAELAAALQPSRERQLEALAQGHAFAETTRNVSPNAGLELLARSFASAPSYPVAVGAAAEGAGIPLPAALHAFLHAVTANLVSAGVRLIPLGQTDGQRVIGALLPAIEAVAEEALTTPLDEMGSAAFRADLASMHHETQYTRLFRS